MTSEDADGLGSTVRAARLSLGLSQAALARRAGISPSYLSRIEGAAWLNGGPWPSDGVLRALARALNLSSTSLIERRERARGAAPAPARGNGRT
ncbi:MAG: helix-turn-helix domain-containing protein, partial [Acidimicrobiales bacterium]